MLDNADRLHMLLQKSMQEDLSFDEQMELDSQLESYTTKRKLELAKELSDSNLLTKEFNEYYQLINESEQPSVSTKVVPMHELKRAYLKWVAAAAIIIIAGLGVYFWQTNKQPIIAKTDKEQQPTPQDIMPANGFAILVLDDDRKIVLDSADNGVIASNGGKQIINQDGQISYQGQSKEVVYNTLVTSKGKVMRLPLADGSTVWLNAESSIRFPTEFPGSERIVEVTGEVNFTVAKNAKKPFKVIVQTPAGKKAEVQVLGTHFNINAYDEEPTIQTTLIEGSVKISDLTHNSTRILVPGQQAAIDKTGNLSVVNNVNTDAVIAWKDRNFFYFKSNDIKTIMRQLARWYDITVKYEGNLNDRPFSGQINRELSLSDVLKLLEQANVQFSMKGREITVKE